MYFLIFPPFIREAPVERGQKKSTWQDLKDGSAYIRNKNYLITGILILIILNFFAFGALQIVIPLLVDLLGGTPINLSLMEASLGIGMIVSTGVLSVVNVSRRGLTTILGLFATLIALVIFSQASSLSVLTIIIFFMGFSMSFVFIPFFTEAQENTDSKLMGRVMSIIFLAMNGFDPIAYRFVSGLIAININIQAILLGSAVLGLILTSIIALKAKDYIKN